MAGPATVVSAAPTASASSSAASESPSGATIASSSSAAAATSTSPGSVARQSESRIVILRPAFERDELLAGGGQGGGEIGRAVAAQGEHAVDDGLDRASARPAT